MTSENPISSRKIEGLHFIPDCGPALIEDSAQEGAAERMVEPDKFLRFFQRFFAGTFLFIW